VCRGQKSLFYLLDEDGPVQLRRLIRVPDGLAHIVRLPVAAVLETLRPRSLGT